jgi:hypothetical protein
MLTERKIVVAILDGIYDIEYNKRRESQDLKLGLSRIVDSSAAELWLERRAAGELVRRSQKVNRVKRMK